MGSTWTVIGIVTAILVAGLVIAKCFCPTCGPAYYAKAPAPAVEYTTGWQTDINHPLGPGWRNVTGE